MDLYSWLVYIENIECPEFFDTFEEDEEKDRKEDECSARIYGSEYYELESRIQEILEK